MSPPLHLYTFYLFFETHLCAVPLFILASLVLELSRPFLSAMLLLALDFLLQFYEAMCHLSP